MPQFIEAVNGPLQRSGEYWGHADQIIRTTPQLLEARGDAEVTFLSTEQVTLTKNDFSANEASEAESVKNMTFALAVHKNKDGYKSGDPLLLIVNGNYSNPIFAFERNTDSVFYLDQDISTISDAHTFIPKIINKLEAKVYARQQSEEVAKMEKKENHRRLIHRTVGAFITAAALVGASSLTYRFFHNRNVSEQQQILKENKSRESFDERNIQINGDKVQAGEMSYITPNLGIFAEKIPDHHKGEDYAHIRMVDLNFTDQCKTITNILPKSQAVEATTDAASERLYVAVNSAGKTQICYFGDLPSTESDVPRVAVQVVPIG